MWAPASEEGDSSTFAYIQTQGAHYHKKARVPNWAALCLKTSAVYLVPAPQSLFQDPLGVLFSLLRPSTFSRSLDKCDGM